MTIATVIEAFLRHLPHAIISTVLGLVFYVAARTRPKADQATGFRTAEYPMPTKALGWFSFLCGGGLLLFAVWARRSSNAPTWFVGLFGAFFAGGGCLLLEFSLTRVTWSDYEITMCSAWSAERRIPWTDVESVTYSKRNSWFVVKSRMGVTMRLHTMLGGLPSLLGEMRSRLPPAVCARALEGIAQLSG